MEGYNEWRRQGNEGLTVIIALQRAIGSSTWLKTGDFILLVLRSGCCAKPYFVGSILIQVLINLLVLSNGGACLTKLDLFLDL